MKRKASGFRKKLICAFLLVSTIPLLLSFAASLYTIWIYRQTTTRNFLDTMVSEKQQGINNRLLQIISSSDTLTTYLASALKVKQRDGKSYEDLTRFVQLRDFVSNLTVSGSFENIRVYSDNFPFLEGDHFSFFPLKEFVDTEPGKSLPTGRKATILSAKNTQSASGKELVSFFRTIKDIYGNVIATFCIDINADDLCPKIEEEGFGTAILSEKDGVILSNLTPKQLSFAKRTDLDIQNCVLSNSQFYLGKSLRFSDWDLLFTAPADGSYPVNRQLTIVFIVISALAVFICVYAGVMSSGVLTYRIDKLHAAVERLNTLGDIIPSPERLDLLARDNRRGDEIDKVISAFINLVKKNNQLYETALEKEIDIQKYRYDVLQEQINPHFLYNALDTIRACLLLGREELSCRLVENLSRFYRICLSRGRSIISLEEELEMIRQYLSIEQIGYENQIVWQISCTPDCAGVTVPKFILQPIVENAVVHGKKGVLHIDISARSKDGRIEIQVKDDGKGMDAQALRELQAALDEPPSQKATAHFGLLNVGSRLKLHFGPESGLRLQNNPSGGLIVSVLCEKSPEKGNR